MVGNWRNGREALSIIRAHNLQQEKTLTSISKSESQLCKTASEWSQNGDDTGEATRLAKKIIDIVSENGEQLAKILTGLDAQRDFFLEYSPKHFERRLRIENLLDAQYRKLRGRPQSSRSRVKAEATVHPTTCRDCVPMPTMTMLPS